MKIKHISFFLMINMLFFSCESQNEEENIHPLVGTYTLTSLSVESLAYSSVDTIGNPIDELDPISILSGDLVIETATIYTTNDGIEGTVILNEDGTAYLAGTLPANIGTGCDPWIILGSVASDGEWAVDLETSVFELNLDYDLLDIQGTYNYEEVSQVMQIIYTVTNPTDTLGVLSLSGIQINSLCLPVTSETTRTLEFIKE